MEFVKDVETNSVSLRLRKSSTAANLSSHTILTDDFFSFVDFFFKTHKRIIRDASGKEVKQNHLFYWEQAKNFYYAAKSLPIESAPLPMYYCMLNAIKAYLIYNCRNFDEIKKDFNGHGLYEYNPARDVYYDKLENIYVRHADWGVFYRFANTIEENFTSLWEKGDKKSDKGALSLKDLLYQLPFVHGAYVSTYNLPRRKEKFIPLKANTSPTFRYGKDNKIRLVIDLDKNYFKQDASSIPEEIQQTIPAIFMINPENCFQLISETALKKKELSGSYVMFREWFRYIKSERKIWYFIRQKTEYDVAENMNSMLVEIAVVHRFSEIVRYKPEQMTDLLQGKESWLIHEFLSLVLDQFMDELACEITKQEIMPTRMK